MSEDEIEKLKQENEKKIATITRETKKKFANTTTTTTTSSNDNINNNEEDDDDDENQFDINDNDDGYEIYRNKNLIISQQSIEDDDDSSMRWVDLIINLIVVQSTHEILIVWIKKAADKVIMEIDFSCLMNKLNFVIVVYIIKRMKK